MQNWQWSNEICRLCPLVSLRTASGVLAKQKSRWNSSETPTPAFVWNLDERIGHRNESRPSGITWQIINEDDWRCTLSFGESKWRLWCVLVRIIRYMKDCHALRLGTQLNLKPLSLAVTNDFELCFLKKIESELSEERHTYYPPFKWENHVLNVSIVTRVLMPCWLKRLIDFQAISWRDDTNSMFYWNQNTLI